MRRVLWIALALHAAPSGAHPIDPIDPIDPSSNPFLRVESATIVSPMVPGETTVELLFDRPVSVPPSGVSAFGSRKNPVITSTWTSPVLEDLNGDQKLDLVVADAMSVLVFRNVGQGAELLFEESSTLIATRTVTSTSYGSPPISHWDTALSFGDADGDGDRDLICGEKWHGNVLFFPMMNQSYQAGQIRTFGTQRPLRFESNGQKSNIAVATEDYTTTTPRVVSAARS